MSDLSIQELIDAYHADTDHELFEGQNVNIENIEHVPAEDTVSVYFRQMAAEPLLTSEQEIALGRRIDHGQQAAAYLDDDQVDLSAEQREMLQRIVNLGQQARDHLGRANTRLVVSIAKRYRNQGLPMSDLIQEGNVGLMIAVDKFDHSMGNRFSTYASWWIRQTITRALSQKSRTIRLPLHRHDQLRRINTAMEFLQKELGRKPTYSELGEHLDLPADEVADTLEHTPDTVGLEAPVGEDSELGDFLEDTNSITPDELMHDIALEEAIDKTLSQIMPREAKILRLRYGLDDDGPKTLEQVGKLMGLSRERIRQLERKALRRLREPQFAVKLRDFVPTR